MNSKECHYLPFTYAFTPTTQTKKEEKKTSPNITLKISLSNNLQFFCFVQDFFIKVLSGNVGAQIRIGPQIRRDKLSNFISRTLGVIVQF